MSLNDFTRPNVYDCYWTLFIFSALLLSTDQYLQDSKKDERTARSHFRKGPGYEVLVAYTTWFHTKKVKMSRRSCKWENNYFVTSISWTIRLQRHGKLLVKINYSFDKDQTTRFIIWWQKLFWFICLFETFKNHQMFLPLQGIDNSISIGRIERRCENCDTNILYIWENLTNTNNIYSTNISKTRNHPQGLY